MTVVRKVSGSLQGLSRPISFLLRSIPFKHESLPGDRSFCRMRSSKHLHFGGKGSLSLVSITKSAPNSANAENSSLFVPETLQGLTDFVLHFHSIYSTGYAYVIERLPRYIWEIFPRFPKNIEHITVLNTCDDHYEKRLHVEDQMTNTAEIVKSIRAPQIAKFNAQR